MTKLQRIRGQLRLDSGTVVPIKNRHVADALASAQSERENARGAAADAMLRLRAAENKLDQLSRHWWIRLGKLLRLL